MSKKQDFAWQAGNHAESTGLIQAKTLLAAKRAARKYALTMYGKRAEYRLFKLVRPPYSNEQYWQVMSGIRVNGKWAERNEE